MEHNALDVVLLGIAAAVGLYAGKLARAVHLPSLVGYMFLGVVLGISALNVIDEAVLEDLTFVTEIALAFVAFTIGSELELKSLRRQGIGIVSIIFAESFGAFFVVLAGTYALTRDMPMSLLLAAVAPASAPAGTVAVIQECRARGPLTKTLYAVVGFDDGLAILIFGFADAIARSILLREATGTTEDITAMLSAPAMEIAASLAVGAVIGFVFSALVRHLQRPGEIFVLLFGAILVASGIALRFELSLILTNMVTGFVLANTRRDETVRRVMAPISQFMPLLFVLFFCLAGAHLNLRLLPSLGVLGIVYILCRAAGLVGGSYLGALLGRVEERVRSNVGMGILSQAGVAIGLALIAKQQFEKIGSVHALSVGAAVITSVTATSIVFEIIGPILTKIALRRAGEIDRDCSA